MFRTVGLVIVPVVVGMVLEPTVRLELVVVVDNDIWRPDGRLVLVVVVWEVVETLVLLKSAAMLTFRVGLERDRVM